MFLPFLLIAITLKPLSLLYNNKYQKLPKLAWTYTALNESKKKNANVKVLVIGDSVANQLFRVGKEANSDKIHSLTCSAAIDIVGQYILMSNYLEQNEPDAVILMNSGYKFNLNAPQVFHYFLKTFFVRENYKHITDLACSRIKKVPYYFLSQVPHFKTSTWGPKIEFVPDRTGRFFSELGVQYVHKMDSLARSKGVKFMAIPPPIRNSRKKEYDEHWDKEIERNELGYIFRHYRSNLKFAEPVQFRDVIHLKKDIAELYIAPYRKRVLECANLQ